MLNGTLLFYDGDIYEDGDIEFNEIRDFDYDEYGRYIEYSFIVGDKYYHGYENLETFNFKKVIRKPVINNFGKFMNRIFAYMLETSNGMVYLDVQDEDDFENIFDGISHEDIKQFFKDYEWLLENVENFDSILEVWFTEDSFKELKKGNFDSLDSEGNVVTAYGDFLTVFNIQQ